MAEDFKMVIVGGVRYRPEDAPKKESAEPEEKQAEKPANKSRTVSNKSASTDDK